MSGFKKGAGFGGVQTGGMPVEESCQPFVVVFFLFFFLGFGCFYWPGTRIVGVNSSNQLYEAATSKSEIFACSMSSSSAVGTGTLMLTVLAIFVLLSPPSPSKPENFGISASSPVMNVGAGILSEASIMVLYVKIRTG